MPSTSSETFGRSMIDACKTYTRAVEASLAFSRAMWRLAFESGWEAPPTRSSVCLLPEDDVQPAVAKAFTPFATDPDQLAADVLGRISTPRLAADGMIRMPFWALLPLHAARELIGGIRPDNDLRFFVARAIRRHYRCVLSARVADVFRRLSDTFNELAEGDGHRRKRFFAYVTELAPAFRAELKLGGGHDQDFNEQLSLFVECCRMVDYLQPSYNPGKVNLRARQLDPEFLLARLFGLPSGIDGFDVLFGGGLMLVDDIAPNEPAQIRGRTVLTMGRYATGKSVLALEMAVAVATKGGVAWVMPLEQTVEECLYTLRSMCRLPLDGSVVVATDTVTARACLEKPKPDRGAIILLRTIKESFEHFRGSFEDNVAAMQGYPIKLIVVDPINAIHRDQQPNAEASSRGQMLRLFEEAKNAGTNVWLIAEEGIESSGQSIYEQNITDTVIHLTLKDDHGDVQRYFEVTKSRLQREQRGKHPYSIVTGQGLAVYPSASSVAERMASRRTRPPDTSAEFGFKPLDDILGVDGLKVGDVVVLDGPAGSLKSQLGLLFLLHSGLPKARAVDEMVSSGASTRSFLVAARDDETSVQAIVDQQPVRRQFAAFQSSKRELKISSLKDGFVHPGYILQQIEREFTRGADERIRLDRIMIDDVSHWETGCPYVRDDETFGDTLVDMLRRYAVTSLLVCSRESGHKDSSLQQAIIDKADCVIRFERIQFRGTDRIVLRVIKTRGMRHRRETFELSLDGNVLELKPTSSLLRVQKGGRVDSVGIRLFLHAESSMQVDYNKAILATVRSVLSPNAKAVSQQRVYMNDALALASTSSVDELQLLQLDQFQVPDSGPNDRSILRHFTSDALTDRRLGDYLPRLTRHSRETFSVLPFYVNISLLAYRRDQLPRSASVESWEALAEECLDWEGKHPNPDDVFFDFPGGPGENYNCLFLEILLSMMEPSPTAGRYSLQEWLGSTNARKAATFLRILCRRSHAIHARHQITRLASGGPIRMNPNAIVWRTWYSTLNQLMMDLPSERRLQIEVTALPKRVAIAGEWYIGVPVHSAAPDVGLKLMEFLTSREAELDRMKLGVGLPTRASFYRPTHPSVRSRVSPYFDMNMGILDHIVREAFARSTFPGYSQVSGIMSAHLQTMIEIENDQAVPNEIAMTFDSLAEKIGFMQNQSDAADEALQSERPLH